MIATVPINPPNSMPYRTGISPMIPRTSLSMVSDRTTTPAISILMKMALANPSLISLAAGFVDQATLPVGSTTSDIAGLAEHVTEARRALQYGTTVGDDQLRSRLVGLIESNEGVVKGTYQSILPHLVVTTGSQQLLYLVAEALIDLGDIVLVESPTYFVFLGLLESRGARVIGIETDDQGMRLDVLNDTLTHLELEGQLSRVKLIYTVSEHSNPSGISLGADRRGELVKLAREWSEESSHRIFILEDSAYRGLTYEGAEPSSVWRHDVEGDTVILARTFSKTFSPGLKTGYGVLPATLVEPVLRLKGNHDFGSSNFNQVVLSRLIADGSYANQIDILIDCYRRKRDVMLDALDTYFGQFEGVNWTRPSGGLYVWLSLPEGLDTGLASPYFQRCLGQGVMYVPGMYAFATEHGPAPGNHARLCFGVAGEDDLVAGIQRMSKALSGCLASVG